MDAPHTIKRTIIHSAIERERESGANVVGARRRSDRHRLAFADAGRTRSHPAGRGGRNGRGRRGARKETMGFRPSFRVREGRVNFVIGCVDK